MYYRDIHEIHCICFNNYPPSRWFGIYSFNDVTKYKSAIHCVLWNQWTRELKSIRNFNWETAMLWYVLIMWNHETVRVYKNVVCEITLPPKFDTGDGRMQQVCLDKTCLNRYCKDILYFFLSIATNMKFRSYIHFKWIPTIPLRLMSWKITISKMTKSPELIIAVRLAGEYYNNYETRSINL